MDDLVVGEVPPPELRPGTARLRVVAAGIDHADRLLIEGGNDVDVATPFVAGLDFVGHITALADDVARDAAHLEVGSRVLARTLGGGFAEEAVVPAHLLTVLPDDITDGRAATFPRSYLTATFALRMRAGVERGETMLVSGAGGGTGLAAVDVAASMRLRVIAAASTEEQRGLALERGAEAAVDLERDDVEQQVRDLTDGVDHVYDPVGGALGGTWLRCLRAGGQYLVIGFVAGIPSLPLDRVLLRNRSVIGVDWDGWAAANPAENTSLLHSVVHEISIGRLRPVEPTPYPLEGTVDALRSLVERRASGKLVIIP